MLLVGHQTSYEPARFAARDLRTRHALRCAYFEYPGLEEAADTLGINVTTLWRKRRRYKIE